MDSSHEAPFANRTAGTNMDGILGYDVVVRVMLIVDFLNGKHRHRTHNNYSEVRDVRGKVRHLDIPILVLQGQCDFMPFVAAYEYVDLFNDARFVFIEAAGHIIWWDRPEKYMQAIAGFLNEQ